MTEQEVMSWMESRLIETKAKTSAMGMINTDIAEVGFESWLTLPPDTIVASYLQVTEEISQDMVDSFVTMFSQESDLRELGIEQTLTLDPSECIGVVRNGMTDIMRSLFHYIETQRMANDLIKQHEN
jgi:hypothetical protein